MSNIYFILTILSYLSISGIIAFYAFYLLRLNFENLGNRLLAVSFCLQSLGMPIRGLSFVFSNAESQSLNILLVYLESALILAGMILFLLFALFIAYGDPIIKRPSTLILASIVAIGTLFFYIVLDSLEIASISINSQLFYFIHQSLLGMITISSTLIIYQVVAIFILLRVYNLVDPITKTKMKYFLVGTVTSILLALVLRIIGSLLSPELNLVIRGLSNIGVAIGILIILQGFRKAK